MPTTTIPTIARSDTIDQWRIQTNKSATDLNDLGFFTYEKDQGQLVISNTANVSITASGTPLSVANNVLFQSNLTLANNMFLGVVGAATGNLIAGGTIRVTGPGTALNVANNVLVGADVQVVNNVYVQNITANGNVSVTRNISSAGILRLTGLANVMYVNTGTATINRVLSTYMYSDNMVTANLIAGEATITALSGSTANIGTINNNILNSNDINSNTLDTIYANVNVLVAQTSANLVTLTSNVSTINNGTVQNLVSTNSTITNGTIITGNVVTLSSNVATVNTSTTLVGTIITGNVVTLNSNVATVNTGTIRTLSSSNANVTNASITFLSSSNTITANTLISNNIEVSTANAAWINVSNNLSVKTGGSIRVFANTVEDEVLVVDGKTTLQTTYVRGNITIEGIWTALGNVEYETSEFTLNSNTATNADATIRNNRVVGNDAIIRWDENDDQWKVSKGNTYSSLHGILDSSFLNATVTSNSTANVATPSAVKAAYDTAVVAGDYANSAYTTANSASSYANGAFVAANSAGVYANAAFLAANTANAFLIITSATVGRYANSAYIQANAAFNAANTADQRAVTSGVYANAAYAQANTATTNAGTSDQKAVSAGSYANSAYTTANTGVTNAAIADQKAVTSGSYANSAYALANNLVSFSADAYARPHSNAAFNLANTTNTVASGALQRTSASSQTIASDLTINGNATFPNNRQLISYNAIIAGTISANGGFVTVNNGLLDTSGPTQNGGIRVKRGTSTDAFIRWNESISPPRWQYSDNAGNFVDFNASSLLSQRATNIAGGSGNRIPVQSSADNTTFIDAPSTANRFLQWTGSGFAWASAATDLSNLSASNLTSGTVPSARMSGSYPIDISGKASTSGNADTVTNGVYTTGSYSNPGFITSLAYGKLTGTPTIPTLTSQLTNNSGFITGTPWTSYGYVTSSGVTALATGNGLTGGTVTSTGTISMSGSYSGTFYASGTITSGGDVVANSDRKLKENLEKIENALSKVRQLTGYTYTRNDVEDQTERHTGLIAQDVEVVLPEAVTENEGIKGVAYGQMMGLICEAIKELDDKLEEIKKQLSN
jgi:hypothetical protein